MINSASVFPFSQQYFYSVLNLSNDHKIVYYEEDGRTKGRKQIFFVVLEGKTSLFQVFNWKDGHFVSMKSFIIILYIYEYFYAFCFSMDKGRAAALRAEQLSPCGVVPCEAWLQPQFLAKSPMACFGCKEVKQERYPSAFRPIFNPNLGLDSA